MEAAELFDICRELAGREPSAAATRQLHEVLTLVCAEGCRNQGGAFGNVFSQIDFLGRHLALSANEIRDLQTARRHSNTGAAISTADWPYDVKAVARLASAVFKEAVPGNLLCLLPANERPHTKGLSINNSYIRCIVSSIDKHLIYANTDDGTIAIDYRNTDSGRDFAYLGKLIKPGMQLNLLESHVDTTTPDITTVVPGQVIVEPDFLIDISSLAACFTDYGHHPLIYTLNRLKERPNTQATLLGNFAGTALDDIISHGDKATMGTALQRSFREQALRFCACPDLDAPKFKAQAEQQMKNIREAIDIIKTLISKQTPLLEASFVCERLGLQGRVDLMTWPPTHTTPALLVEQKSGKNMKIEHHSHDSHGLQTESHYVQLLLYYGVLRYNFELSERQVDTRLLYSRYPASQGLLAVNYYRTLLREALQLRNQIVATELLIAREGFGRILPLLNTDYIYKGIARDSHFHRYVQPATDSLAHHLSLITPLERTYYERMLTFVYREQAAQKLGSAESRLHHSGGCNADLWLMPLSEKIEAGEIIIASPPYREKPSPQQPSPRRGDGIVFPLNTQNNAFPQNTLNFRQGDMVNLYCFRHDEEPDARKSILFKGVIQEMGNDSVTVALTNNQQNLDLATFGSDRLWAIEHGSSDVGTGSAIRSMQMFITAPPHRRSLFLGQRAPKADPTLTLSRLYHPAYDGVLLKIKQARDYFLLVGPPGTGKTSMALRFIVEEELRTSNKPSILLTAYTNRAVDEICAMLCSLLPSLGKGSFLRIGNAASCDERYRPYLLDTALAGTGTLEEARSLIDSTPVIVSTTSMLLAQSFIMQLKQFSLTIVDEASQILEPGLIGILSSEAVGRFVLVGDYKQLPAVVQQESGESIISEPCLQEIGLTDCRHSLFERLIGWEHRQRRAQFTGILHFHGRMHPDVASFPLQHFYAEERLCAVPLPHQQEKAIGYAPPSRDYLDRLLLTHRVLFIDTNEVNQEHHNSTLQEQVEARIVADLLQRIHRFTAPIFDASKTVGVIVPYRRQIALIRQQLHTLCPQLPAEEITIDTVERYQGSQRDVIIYSLGVSHRYQMDFITASTFNDSKGRPIDRKLNVALTRARRQTIVVGNGALLSHSPQYREFILRYK